MALEPASRARELGEYFDFGLEITPEEMYGDGAIDVNTRYVITQCGGDGHRTHIFEMVPFRVNNIEKDMDGFFWFKCSTLSTNPARFTLIGDLTEFSLKVTGLPKVKIRRLEQKPAAAKEAGGGGAGGGVSFMPKLKPNHRTWEFRER